MIDSTNFFFSKEACIELDQELYKIVHAQSRVVLVHEECSMSGLDIQIDHDSLDEKAFFVFLDYKFLVEDPKLDLALYTYKIDGRADYFLNSGGFTKLWEKNHKQELKEKRQWYLNLFTVFISLSALGLTTYFNYQSNQKLETTKVVQERDAYKAKYDSLQNVIHHLNQPTPTLKAKTK